MATVKQSESAQSKETAQSKPKAATVTTASDFNFDEYEKAINEAVTGWEEEQVGFPPYWNPSHVGNALIAKVIMRDERDPSFVRYILQAVKFPLVCKKGPSEDAEQVIVQPGEFFTMSAYAALPLERFFDLEVVVKVANKRKLPGNEASDGVKRDLWEFKVLVSPESKKILANRREDEHKRLLAARTKQEEAA